MTPKTQGFLASEQVRAFLEGAQPLCFETLQREAAYDFIARRLRPPGQAKQVTLPVQHGGRWAVAQVIAVISPIHLPFVATRCNEWA